MLANILKKKLKLAVVIGLSGRFERSLHLPFKFVRTSRVVYRNGRPFVLLSTYENV